MSSNVSNLDDVNARQSVTRRYILFIFRGKRSDSTWRLSLANDTCAYSAALSPFLLLASPFVVGRSFTVVDRRRHAFACSSKKGVTPRCDNGTIIRANNNDVGNWDVNVRAACEIERCKYQVEIYVQTFLNLT